MTGLTIKVPITTKDVKRFDCDWIHTVKLETNLMTMAWAP